MTLRDERGLSQSVQYAVIFPALMLVTLGIIQVGVWEHGHNVAVRAAAAGADSAHGSYGSVADARSTAQALAEAGGLHEVNISVDRGATQVAVTVNGRVPLIVDLGLGLISETAHAPVEHVTQ